MTTTTVPNSRKTTDLKERAAAVGPTLAEHAARHDTEGSFVTEAYDALRDSGLLKAGVPAELGGDGATISELTALQRELAHHCASAALASSMHHHVVAFTAWRYRRNLQGAEATLRRVAEQGILLVSTGGGDYTHPRGEAVKVDGGYRVTGRKRFASQSSHGTVMATMFTYDDPEQGRRVLNVAVPIGSQGVTVADNWDTLGMRGTASNDIVIKDVFVPDERVLANRPYGVVDPPLQVISEIAFPIISGVYLGVAEAAYQAAIAVAVSKAETYLAVMSAKAEITEAGVEVCDLAMDVAGGSAFFKGSVIERCYRDIRAAKFHPLTPEDTLVETGRHALGIKGLLA